MTRQEHIEWAKKRAIEEMDYYKDPTKAIVSMMSDLGKHQETNNEGLKSLCMMTLLTKPKISRQEVINFLNGFR